MNMNPSKFKAYKRYFNNQGDVMVPGFDPYTGREINERRTFETMLRNTLQQNLKKMFTVKGS